MRLFAALAIVVALLCACGTGAYCSVVYVKWDSPNDGPGNDWDHAYHTVAAGLTAAVSGDEVWVAAGTYVERITLKLGVALYGGFAGTETALGQRNWETNVTILDGNQVGPVVTSPSGASLLTRIDGLTIRNGIAYGVGGGGIYCSSSSPTIANNRIVGNRSIYGGGIYCHSSSPAIVDNRISDNHAAALRYGATGYGGGIYCDSSCLPNISNNIIEDNTAHGADGDRQYLPEQPGRGGGIYCDCAAIITNNVLLRNVATGGENMLDWGVIHYAPGEGGGIYCSDAATIANNILQGNYACLDNCGDNYGDGGGIWLSAGTATNNTLVDNTAANGGGVFYKGDSSAAISNNIVAWNSPGICASGTLTPVLRNNDVYANTTYNYSGISAGTGDISLDPLFVNAVGGDYHITAASPCINAGWNSASGIPALDIDDEARLNGTIDIGADEFWPISANNAKLSRDGLSVDIDGAVVSSAFTDFFYIESDDRTCGIRVDKAGHTLTSGMRVHVIGTLGTNSDGERYIAASDAHQCNPPDDTGSVTPLAMPNKSLGGGDWNYLEALGSGQEGIDGAAGLNNIGLLIRTCGKFTWTSDTTFTLEDGSGVDVDCVVEGITLNLLWDYVTVTGISSCIDVSGDLHRLIRVTDVTPM